MLPRLAATALLLTTLPASAAFLERHEHWTVTGGSAPSCIAVNRPPAEFNHQPYAALAIHQRRNRGPRLQVFAWPGAFKSGDKVTIEIRIGPGTQLAAEAMDSYLVQVKDTLPAELIGEMRAVGLVPFGITGLRQSLLFDLSQIEAVMKSLDTCVRQHPR
jgi:hypothetical protein